MSLILGTIRVEADNRGCWYQYRGRNWVTSRHTYKVWFPLLLSARHDMSLSFMRLGVAWTILLTTCIKRDTPRIYSLFKYLHCYLNQHNEPLWFATGNRSPMQTTQSSPRRSSYNDATRNRDGAAWTMRKSEFVIYPSVKTRMVDAFCPLWQWALYIGNDSALSMVSIRREFWKNGQ